MRPGSAASISSATTCAAPVPFFGRGSAERRAKLLDRGVGSTAPLVEAVEELARVVSGEAEEILHGVHSAPR